MHTKAPCKAYNLAATEIMHHLLPVSLLAVLAERRDLACLAVAIAMSSAVFGEHASFGTCSERTVSELESVVP